MIFILILLCDVCRAFFVLRNLFGEILLDFHLDTFVLILDTPLRCVSCVFVWRNIT